MRARIAWAWILFLCSASWLLPQSSKTIPSLQVEEGQLRLSLGSPAHLDFPVLNNTSHTIQARLHLELLHVSDEILRTSDHEFAILPGSHMLTLPWTVPAALAHPFEIYWLRIRYRISASAEDGPVVAQGTVQIGSIASAWMRIDAVSPRHAAPGSTVPVRVRVEDVRTDKGLAGVQVQATMEESGGSSRPVSTHDVKTDGQGYALLMVNVPAEADKDSDFQITAHRGDITVSKSLDLDLKDRPQLNISTDKPIYQPGQTLHMRVLALRAPDRVVANQQVTFSVKDDNGTPEFKQESKTSKFGIAAADWEIPSQIQTGPYIVRVDMGDALEVSEVRISRYELPEFTVVPITDKAYYLPGQALKVEVSASYLFGQPVKRGKVRIVHEGRRSWNSETKSYDIEETELKAGELDSSGKFSGVINLGSDFEQLKDADYLRYRDLNLTAYVTDLSTNRTEQKRFTVRLSREQIHLYVMNSTKVAKQPLDMYLTAAFPDGTSASVDLTVSAVRPTDDGEFPDAPRKSDQVLIAYLHTNQYGVAHLQAHPLAPGLLVMERGTDSSSEVRLVVQAHDRQGRRGVHSEHFFLKDGQYFRIQPVKRIFQAGESVAAAIESSAPDQVVFVDLLGRGKLLDSKRLQLRHGRAEVEFAYAPEFRNSLYLVAYNMAPQWAEEKHLSAGAEVLFPEPQDLNLGVHLGRTTYKPGEPATVDFRVRSPEGRPVQSALGILVYDKAVAERVRSDQEVGPYGFDLYDYNDARYPTIAGFGYRDLLNQKLTRPVIPDMELLAEALLFVRNNDRDWRTAVQDNTDSELEPWDVFHGSINRSLLQVQEVLRQNYIAHHGYPNSNEEFRTLLLQHQIDFDQVRDPWGMPYFLNFGIEDRNAVLEIRSCGAAKHPGTDSEFVAESFDWPFFGPAGSAMDLAAANYAQSTGKYIHDLATLRLQLETYGINVDALRDPWGQPYSFTFEVEGPNYRINALSRGPAPPPGRKSKRELLTAWQTNTRYFQNESKALDRALAKQFHATRQFPSNEGELRPILEAAGITGAALFDPWGRPYHFEFEQSSRYGNSIDISVYDASRSDKLAPVTQQLAWIYVFSYGPANDPKRKIEVARFSQILAEQDSQTEKPNPISPTQLNPIFLAQANGASGAISGTVTDPTGAVIANAQVTAIDEVSGARYTTTVGEDGLYLLSNLPAGKYRVEIEARGFNASIVRSVPVTSSNVTKLDVRLKIGQASETVEVAAAAWMVETTSAQVSNTVQDSGARIQPQQQAFTPRLRKYFPETLVWRPELVTDSSGKAQLKFAMADNITSWKMSVIASNTEGQLAIAEKELRTFLPFFVDHDPPKFLTQGDQIELPVVLRNYTDRTQEVAVELSHAPWFTMLSAAQQRVAVAPGGDANAHFLLRADQSIREGKERVAAANRDTADAIERSITVHPDGQSVTQTVAQVSAGERTSIEVQIPLNAIPGSTDAQLKVFPNLDAHVLDSIHGMVARPAGCGEQITSIAFGSLLALQVLRKGGQDDPARPGNPNSELAAQARKYLRDAYQQLLALQDSNGGFPYWMHDEPNLALSAYILDFLSQASQFIDVDRDVMTRTRKFIVAAQGTDGAWSQTSYDRKLLQDPNLTALIARSLADAQQAAQENSVKDEALNKALDFLSTHLAELKDPYLLGQYSLAVAQSGRKQDLENARKILAGMAHEEGAVAYWNLEANASPFYSWGFAGRIETTGLVVQALARIARYSHDAQDQKLANRGLLYLLTHKDSYGVWYSTHASVNVLRAIIEATPDRASQGESSAADVRVNGKPAAQLKLPAPNALSGPIMVEISSLLVSGANKVEIIRQGSSPLWAQVVSTHYVPWSNAQAASNSTFKAGESRALRLNVTFDQLQTQIGKDVKCTVEAERIGFAGYGMMLAEVGLPPGSDVDRASLQSAMDSYAINKYEIMPDRLVVYLWPKAGGSKFSFSFKPRFAMHAAAAPSILYDYYNPEAQAVVAPAHFTVN